MTSLPFTGPHPDVVYTGRSTSWPMVLGTSVAVIPLVAIPALEGAWGWAVVIPLVLAAIGVAAELLTASSVRCTAGPNGVTVHWGVIGWPRSRYALAAIEDARVVDLPWWRVSWGFWWTPKRTSCTVRSGPTLRLALRSGRTVTITVPEPDAAVAALHEARSAPGR